MPYTAEATLATFPAYSINTLNRMLPVNYLGQGRENRGIFLFHGQVIGSRTNPAKSRADARARARSAETKKEKKILAVFRQHYIAPRLLLPTCIAIFQAPLRVCVHKGQKQARL